MKKGAVAPDLIFGDFFAGNHLLTALRQGWQGVYLHTGWAWDWTLIDAAEQWCGDNCQAEWRRLNPGFEGCVMMSRVWGGGATDGIAMAFASELDSFRFRKAFRRERPVIMRLDEAEAWAAAHGQ